MIVFMPYFSLWPTDYIAMSLKNYLWPVAHLRTRDIMAGLVDEVADSLRMELTLTWQTQLRLAPIRLERMS